MHLAGALSQETFEVLFLGPLRFQKISPLNDCLTSEISGSQKVQGLANMVGGAAVPSELGYFSLTIFATCGLALS